MPAENASPSEQTIKKRPWVTQFLRDLRAAGVLRRGDMMPDRSNLRLFIERAGNDNLLYFTIGKTPARDIVAMAEESGLRCFTYKHFGKSVVFASRSDERIDGVCSFLLGLP